MKFKILSVQQKDMQTMEDMQPKKEKWDVLQRLNVLMKYKSKLKA